MKISAVTKQVLDTLFRAEKRDIAHAPGQGIIIPIEIFEDAEICYKKDVEENLIEGAEGGGHEV